MIHDIDAINTAMVLGDQFVPPVGSRVRFDSHDTLWIVRSHFFNDITGKFQVDITEAEDSIGDYYVIPNRVLPRVVSVPAEAPPFEEWPRLNYSYVKG